MSSIIDALQREGAIVFWRDYRSGTLIDWSIPRGLSGTGTHTVGVTSLIEWCGNGRVSMNHQAGCAYDSTPDQAKLQLTEGTLIALCDFEAQMTHGASGERLISKRDAGGRNYEMILDATSFGIVDSAGIYRWIALDATGKKYLATNIKDGEVPDVYVDGVYYGPLSGLVSIVKDDPDLILGNRYNCLTIGRADNISNAIAYMICNRKLTSTEHSRLYSELLNFTWPMLPANRKRAELDTDANYVNMIGAWDMDAFSCTVPDSSGHGHTGTLTGAATAGHDGFCNFIRCDGDTGYLNAGNLGATIKSLAFWIKPSTTTEELAQITTAGRSVRIIAGALSLTGVGLGQVYYVNGVPGNTIVANRWQHIAITCTTGTASDLLYLGRSFYGPNPYFDGCIGPVRLWSTTITAARVWQEYARGRSAGYGTDWGVLESMDEKTAGAQLGLNSPFYVSTPGGFQIVTDEIDGRPVKAIECITNGMFFLTTDRLGQSPSDAAFGTWEWWQYKPAGNFSRAVFSCGTSGWPGYYCDSVGDDSYILYRWDGTPIVSGGAVNGNAWNHIKITRSNNGNFTLWINDVLIGSGIDTTDLVSDFIGFDVDSGDKICYSDIRGNKGFKKKVLV